MSSQGWKLDLSYGEAREAAFLKMFPFLKKVPGYKEDFVLPNGEKVELKAERRTALQTPNIAVEVISSYRRSGAIFNAVRNGCKYICYMFGCGSVFIYNCKLLSCVARRLSKNGVIDVWNSNAKIVLIPRRAVVCLLMNFLA